jgi:hypothetical protein
MSETYSDKGPICPHCQHQHKASDDPYLYDEELTEMECHDCGKQLSVFVFTRTSWTCKAPE